MPSSNDSGPWGRPTGGTGRGTKPSGGSSGKSNGSGPSGRRPGGSPEIEALLENLQSQMRQVVGGGGNNGRKILLIGLGLLFLWLVSGFYRVEQGKLGLELVFGEFVGAPTFPGLNYNFPSPIGEVAVIDVERSRRVDVGYRGVVNQENGQDIPEESLMLTGDQNIVDIDFAVFWKVRSPEAFSFNIRAPEETVKLAAESAMREVIGQTNFDSAVTDGRAAIETRTLDVLQNILDGYGSGILVEKVDMQKSDPPKQVIDSFNDVQRARQDLDRLRNQADAYANTIVPEARGEAEKILLGAEATREKLITEAEGEAGRFIDVYNSYRAAPLATKRRMYLETVGKVLSEADKIIIDNKGGVVPYLPLPQKQTATKK